MRRALPYALLFVLATPRIARAECGTSGRPVVAIREDPSAPLRAEVFEQLRSALADRNIEACEGDAPSAVATLDVTIPADAPTASLTLIVRDAVTNKRVSRDVDLGSMPVDARPLVIAQAGDELLRASWAELLLAGAPKPALAVPIEVARAVEPREAPPPAPALTRPVFEVAGAVAAELFTAGHAQAGPDIAIAMFPWSRVGVRARFGFRASPRASDANGEVTTTALAGAIGAPVGIVPRGKRLGLDVVPELVVTSFSVTGRPKPGASGSSASGIAVHAAIGPSGWVVLAPPLRAGASLVIGAPLRGVRAVDGSETVVGASGMLAGASVFVAGAW